jgi:hypothetical protein
LLGSHGTKCLLGMLTQPSEGNYHIEDLTCQVPLDLSSAQCTAGLFTENCIIVTEGEMLDGKFRVNMVSANENEHTFSTCHIAASLCIHRVYA